MSREGTSFRTRRWTSTWEAAANRLTDRIEPTDLDEAVADRYRDFIDEIQAIRVFRDQDRPATRRRFDSARI